MSQAVRIFLLNHPSDYKYLQELSTQLNPFVKKDKIKLWDPSKIVAGAEVSSSIRSRLEEAEIFIPLVSSDYLADDRFMHIQQMAVNLNLKILPIIVKTCLWEFYDDFTKYDVYPKQANNQPLPLNEWQNKGTAYMNIAHAINALLKFILDERKKTTIITEHQTSSYDLTTIEGIRQVIALNKTEIAIKSIMDYAKKSNPSFEDEISVLSSRFYRIEEGIRIGTLSREEANRERNQIHAALLSILKKMQAS